MEYVGIASSSKADALAAINRLSKEWQPDHYWRPLVGDSIGRVFSRVDGDQFQVSRTAGFGPSAVCSGKVFEANGQTMITLRVTHGVLPASLWLAGALLAFALSIFAGFIFGFVEASFCLAVGLVLLAWYWFKSWDARYLISALTKELGDVSWARQRE